MRKTIAVAFALFGFASQVSAEPGQYPCPYGDGNGLRDYSTPCELTQDSHHLCTYSHVQYGTNNVHRFSVRVD
jgi:hypothetical protein